MQPSYAVQFAPSDLPEAGAAADEYEQGGGSLTRINIFGIDALNERQDLISIRDQRFESDIGSFEEMCNFKQRRGNLFEQAILHFISLTQRLSQMI